MALILVASSAVWTEAQAQNQDALAQDQEAQAQDQDEQQEFGLGTVSITRTRVVFEGRKRSEELLMFNRGTVKGLYRIFFKNVRAREDGSYEDISQPDPGQRFADRLVRYSPRRVVLEPGQSQSVRLLVRKPRDLAPGEYRSHLVFQAVPPPTQADNVEAQDVEEGNISIRLVAQFGISIPVIVRHGDLSAGVEISEMALDARSSSDGRPVLFFRLNREGDRSVYGDIAVTFLAPDGAEVQVGLIRGIAVLTPNKRRTTRLRLAPPEGLELKGGTLRLVYRERPDAGGEVLAEAEIAVP